jgi:5-(carboxyamino)imidazole ribonucleotide synthase
MLGLAAHKLGLRVHVFCPDSDSPAFDITRYYTCADYADEAALAGFAAQVDVITYEFENVPSATAAFLAARKPVMPGEKALEICQDRLKEKTFLEGSGIKVAPFHKVDSLEELAQAVKIIGRPGVLKSRRFGYDGKGQVRLGRGDEAAAAWEAMAGAPAVLEGFVTFSAEVSVIAARGVDGSVAAYDPGENVHQGGILHTTTVPARLSPGLRSDAVLIAARILNALDYVGVMGVELFVTPQGLIVNEIAPRVHNSGHWTQQGCAVDQFEQHIRAVAGWPLGDGSRFADVVMENLIGDDILRVPELARERDTALHVYGKGQPRAGRKMGHVNRIIRRPS